MNVSRYCIFVLTVLVPLLAYVKKSLTLAASLLAVIMVSVSLIASDSFAAFLLLEFLLISIVDHFCKKKSAYINKNLIQKTGTRDIIQVFVNGGMATLCVILWYFTQKTVLLYCFVATLIESFGDSAASDIGIAFGKNTYDICRLKKIENGLSGGVSLEGTLACAVSCFAMAGIAFILHLTNNMRATCFVALSALSGCLMDSVLGALVQRKERCIVCGIITEKRIHCNTPTTHHSGIKWIDNDAVNLLCNIFSAIVALVLFLFWG